MISEFNWEEQKSDLSSESDPHLDTVMEMTLEDTKNELNFQN